MPLNLHAIILKLSFFPNRPLFPLPLDIKAELNSNLSLMISLLIMVIKSGQKGADFQTGNITVPFVSSLHTFFNTLIANFGGGTNQNILFVHGKSNAFIPAD